jgi:formylmethanofuran dehydrogenase subunit E
MQTDPEASTHGAVDWERARAFHGHLGPWLALGLKMGVEALEKLGVERYWKMRVVAECELEPPVTCLIDGLQLATGATMGKRNIEARAGDPVRVSVTSEKTGKCVEFTLLPQAPQMFDDWYNEVGEDETAHRVFEAESAALYETALR